MFCCSHCFADAEIKAIIDGNKKTGHCDFCGSENAHVYEIGKDSIIAELFEGLFDVYTPVSELPVHFPRERTDLMKNILCNSWRIFNLGANDAYRLITAICADRYHDQPELFDGPVAIKQWEDNDYLEENSILKNYQWKNFVNGIKTENRFHSDYVNTEKLLVFLRCAVKTYRKGDVMYRSRICPDASGFAKNEMGAPPMNMAKGGRVNPTGISILYLSDSEATTVYEIRAGMYDFVTVGRFVLQEDIEVINFADIDHISPFIGIDYGFDFTQYAINIEHLKMIAQEIAKPLRNGNALDYLPTQYISDYIRSKGYDGIEYGSTIHENGTNLAVFNPGLFRCTDTKVYDVKSISCKYLPV